MREATDTVSQSTPPSRRGMTGRTLFVTLFVLLTLSFFTFGTIKNWPYKIESDGKYYYQYLVSGVMDGDFDFSDDYRAPQYPWMALEIDHYGMRYEINSTTGLPSNPWTVGPALLWLPSFLVTMGVVSALNAVGVSVDPSPWSRLFQYSVMYSSVLYVLAALYLLYRMLRRHFSEESSGWAIWLLLLTTSLYYYAVFEVSMSHVYDLFTYVAFLYLWTRCTRARSNWEFAALGVAGGLHVLVRTQNLLTIGLFSLVLLAQLVRDRREWLHPMIAYGATLLVVLAPLPLMNEYLYGQMLAVPQGGGFLRWAEPQVLGVLFSMRNGLFSHHPSLLVGAAGYALFLRSLYRDKDSQALTFFITLLVAFVLQVYTNSVAEDWWAGSAFGQRRLVGSLPLFAFGFAYVVQWARWRFPRAAVPTMLTASLLGLYLTAIHVRIWPHDEPHNILVWMLYRAPLAVMDYFLR